MHISGVAGRACFMYLSAAGNQTNQAAPHRTTGTEANDSSHGPTALEIKHVGSAENTTACNQGGDGR